MILVDSKHKFLQLIICTSLVLSFINARAELGGKKISTHVGSVYSKAPHKAATNSNYEVDKITLDSGTVITEYVALNGMVFGVSWIGPAKPNFKEIFGNTNFDRYVTHVQKTASPRSRLNLNESDLVIESSGHQGHFFGRAFLPLEIPPNITIDEIQ
jgi:hypothetical protein